MSAIEPTFVYETKAITSPTRAEFIEAMAWADRSAEPWYFAPSLMHYEAEELIAALEPAA